jgi:signal transduction histidine kinase
LQKGKGLRRRWLINTAGMICALGLICVVLVTVLFGGYYYSAMESDMRMRVETITGVLESVANQDDDAFYQSCIAYVQTFEKLPHSELQFINTSGVLVASSYGIRTEELLVFDDVMDALSDQESHRYIGRDPMTGEHIMAVSGPLFYADGELAGVVCFLTSTWEVHRQIAIVACISFAVLLAVLALVLLSGNYYLKYILASLSQIVDKAKMIANGSYGIQIQTQYDDEIGDLARMINEMSMQINQNEKAQTEFISSLSHELRTPLTAITGWSETLLSSDDLDENTRRGVKIILGEGKRLTEMVLELLDFTRIQDGRMTLNVESTDIRAEFEDTVFMYGSRLAQDGIQLEYLENDDEIPEIPCDPKRLRQVFLNILDNAAKHGGEGKRIDADIACEDNHVLIRIRDYGPGIPEDELSLVKRKFYKGSSKARGSGIGLAVCDEIVQMHGGSLVLENAPGGGTLVTIELPISQ